MRRLSVFLVIASLAGLGLRQVAAYWQDRPASALVVVHGVQTMTLHPDCSAVNPDGTGYRLLAVNADPFDPYAEYNPLCNATHIAALAPDGSAWLSVSRYPSEDDPDHGYDFRLEVRESQGQHPVTLMAGLPYLMDFPPWQWHASWLPDGQHVLFWDEDYTDEDFGPDFSGYLETGRLWLLGISPVTQTLLAEFNEGTTRPVIAITPDGLAALAISPDGEQVLFRFGEPGNMGLYSIRTDGSGIHPLVTSGQVSLCTRWSPDGRLIVFEHWQDTIVTIEVVGADGSGLVTLTAGDSPAWSPDGEQIAFNCGEEPKLCLIRADGSHLEELPTGYAGTVYAPYWSSDGGKIAFIGQPASQPENDSPFNTYDLNVYDLSTGQTTTLFSHEAPYLEGCGSNGAPILWSPDGEWILYEAIEPVMHGGAVAGGGSFWYICNREGCRDMQDVAGVPAIRLVRWMPAR